MLMCSTRTLTALAARSRRSALAFLCLLACIVSGCGDTAKNRVVVYCAHDREFAEDILADFERASRLKVVPRYDTEANKAVGLYEDLVREASRPRCDVHWNNEILATIRLQKQGLLEPYRSAATDAFPGPFRAEDDSWHAFAARARIILVNTDLVPKKDWPTGLKDLAQPRWRDRVALAKPQFGTTATEAACLFQAWGEAAASDFYKQLHANGVHIVAGNKQVAVGVGQGQFAAGMTDTDDAMAEIDAGHPVAIIFPDRAAPEGAKAGTLFLPNTVAVVRGCPNPEGARLLVDFLLSPEVETRLAQCKSRQIPLNRKVNATLAKEIETPHTVRSLPVDFAKAADMWQEVQTFLVREFAK
jgi:iron(III) transport system substrate-binding protein